MADKRVDESWKEQVQQEKQHVGPAEGPAIVQPGAGMQTSGAGVQAPGGAGAQVAGAGSPDVSQVTRPAKPGPEAANPSQEAEGGLPEARFDLFLSGLAMDARIALGDMPDPRTRRQNVSLPHARYLVDLLGILEEKTRGNLSADEDRLLKDALYQLRMRYLAKTGG